MEEKDRFVLLETNIGLWPDELLSTKVLDELVRKLIT